MTQAKRILDALTEEVSYHFATLNVRGLKSVRFVVRIEQNGMDVIVQPDFSRRERKNHEPKD